MRKVTLESLVEILTETALRARDLECAEAELQKKIGALKKVNSDIMADVLGSEVELKQQTEKADVLGSELADCRQEINRLKSICQEIPDLKNQLSCAKRRIADAPRLPALTDNINSGLERDNAVLKNRADEWRKACAEQERLNKKLRRDLEAEKLNIRGLKETLKSLRIKNTLLTKKMVK